MKAINYRSPEYWSNLVRQTRRYGHCYVHAAARRGADYAFCVWSATPPTMDGQAVCFSFRSFGWSLQSGGHKYKVHCTFRDSGKPVPSKDLWRIEAPSNAN